MPSLPRGCCVPVVARLCRTLRTLDSPETSPSQSRTSATRLLMRQHEHCTSLAHGFWHVRLICMKILKLRHVLALQLHTSTPHRDSSMKSSTNGALFSRVTWDIQCTMLTCDLWPTAHRRRKSFARSSEQFLVVQVQKRLHAEPHHSHMHLPCIPLPAVQQTCSADCPLHAV